MVREVTRCTVHDTTITDDIDGGGQGREDPKDTGENEDDERSLHSCFLCYRDFSFDRVSPRGLLIIAFCFRFGLVCFIGFEIVCLRIDLVFFYDVSKTERASLK